MKFVVLASLASSVGLLFVKGAPAPSYKDEAVTSYTISKCVTYYGSISTASVSTSTSSNSKTFYDATTSTSYPYTFTRTPVASTMYSTYPTTIYSTSTIYQTVPTATTISTRVYTTTLSLFVTTTISTYYLTTTAWVPTVSMISAASNFVPMASHVYSLKGTPNTLPAIFASPATTAFVQFSTCFRDAPDLEENGTLAEGNDIIPAASYPIYVKCAALIVLDSTYTVTATGTGTYTTTAPTPLRTSTTTSTVSRTTTSTGQRGSTTVTRTASSTYLQRTTSTILKSTSSTLTTTSRYAASTYYAACGPNNLLWGINSLEIPWPTNGGKWTSLFGLRSAYDCCVYGLKNNFGGSIFHTYTGECQLAGSGSGTCSALTKTFQFYTGCPTTGSWVVSNGNCGQGTWTGKKASNELIEGSNPLSPEAIFESGEMSYIDTESTLVWSEDDAHGPQSFDEIAQEPIAIIDILFDESQRDQPEELKV